MLSALFSGCVPARNDPSARVSRSLHEALSIAQTTQTEAELHEKLGSPDAVGIFNPGDKTDPDFINRLTRAQRNKLLLAFPPTLIDTLPAGTKMSVYFFSYGSALNPTVGALEVGIDGGGRIFGFCYSRSLIGNEKEAMMSKQH